MYIVINCAPDGDLYNIHNSLEESQKDFDEQKGVIEDCGFYEDALYLASVVPGTKFGWSFHGDFFGGELIAEFSL
jgi:hypothetical protein